jgi:hypothetical protein
MTFRFTKADRQQMKSLGISAAKVLQQIETLKRSDFFVRLKRPCTIGDGVRKIDDSALAAYADVHGQAAREGRFMKFVPASGAATRMFQSLLQIFYLPQYLEKEELQKRLDQGVSIACDFKRFIDQLHNFPFVGHLEQTLACDGHLLHEVVRDGRYSMLLEYLLTDRGLGYGNLPKAMLVFHSYPEEHRTAFEEQIAESAAYLCGDDGRLRLHFTIAEEHEKGFEALCEDVCRRCADQSGALLDISFSFQKSSTNTIAVDASGNPFRDRHGRLHFRPAGHGALIENLNDLNADMVYIKNIDNVVPDRLKEPVCLWKKVLGGCLVSIQERVHSLLNRMKHPDSVEVIGEAVAFAAEQLLMDFPAEFEMWPVEKKRAFLLDILDRPVRVCGVVPNAGEPGGAPFWVEDEKGCLSVQIVEKAQVNLDSSEQNLIWNSSTHFNPVDIVCGVRDFEGKPYDLTRFVDPKAVIITRKSIDGTNIRALELPGLWNGGMANWLTVFVEVPAITFSPVKSLFDLLRPEHQSGEKMQRRLSSGVS